MKILTFDLDRIIDDELFEEFQNNKISKEELIKDEIENLEKQGLKVIKVKDNLDLVIEDTKNTFNILNVPFEIIDYNITTVSKEYKISSKKINFIIDFLKTKNYKIVTILPDNSIITVIPPYGKEHSQVKSYVVTKYLNIKSHSENDRTNEEWLKNSENDKKELKEAWKQQQNPDLTFLNWNNDFVLVTFKDIENKEEKTITLKEYKMQEIPYKIKKMVIRPVIENVQCLVDHYELKIELNLIKMSFEVNRKNKLEDFMIKIQDMALKHGLIITKERLIDAICYIGKLNQYNPIEEYLKYAHEKYLLKPDKDIIKKLFDTITTDCTDKEEFIYKFILQMVYVACSNENNCYPAQFLLVLQGKQGCGKTTWFKNLIPKHMQVNYFLEGRSFNLTNKDDILETTTTWLTEMGEIASTFKKSDQESMKNFITAPKDKFRIPYGKESLVKVRTMSLCATTNDIEYLRDLTGSRRYLTLPTDQINAWHDLDIDLIWGYMYSKFLEKEIYWFSEERIEQITITNRNHTVKPDLVQSIEEWYDLYPDKDTGSWLTSNEIYAKLPFDAKTNKFMVGKELKKCNVKLKIKHKTSYFYVKCIKESEV